MKNKNELPYILLNKVFKNKAEILKYYKNIIDKFTVIQKNTEEFEYIFALFKNYCDDKDFISKLDKVLRFEVITSKTKNIRYFIGIIEVKKKEERIYYSYTDCIKRFGLEEESLRLGKWREQQITSILED